MGSKRGRAERCQSKDLLTLKMEEGAKERGWPLEARKGKETDSPSEPLNGTQLCQHLILAQ